MLEQSFLTSALDQALLHRCSSDHGGGTGRLLVAFSGGLDSTVLLHLTDAWCKSRKNSPELVAWHINHGMQNLAPEWEAHCGALAKRWNISFQVDRVSVASSGQGAEAAAREARYGVFQSGLVKGDVLLMAHHLDDQVETFFLRLMRGAGLQGMSGMPFERSLGAGTLLRPLLDVAQETLRDYAADHALPHINDPSNQDVSLDRNFLRQQIMPVFAQRWDGYRQTVTRAGAHMASALETLENQLPVPVTVYSALGDPGVSKQVLACGASDVAAIRLRSWLRSRGLPMPDRAVLEEFLRQLNEGGEDASPRMDSGSYVMQRYADAVYLLPEQAAVEPREVFALGVEGECVIEGVGVLTLVPAAVEGFALADGEALSIAWRTGGERCKPHRRAHSQTLKKLLQERAVPPWWRERVPLVYSGDEMLAVGDLWVCESSRLQQATQTNLPLWQLHWRRNTFTGLD
ncbi:MAG: tRNA lysidine(34) synthetase TilS [Halioglobus sp.]